MYSNYRTGDLQNPKHTWGDLENMVTEKLIEECKVDACIDYYLKGLADINHQIQQLAETNDEYSLMDRDRFVGNFARIPWVISYFLPNPDEWLQKYNHVLNDLKNNLNKLAPGYVEDDSDIFGNKKFKERIQARVESQTHNVFITAGASSFGSNLLNMLAEQRYQGRGIPNCQPLVETYRQLRQLIEGHMALASFTCGGTIAIDDPEASDSTTAGQPQKSSAPVNIFWSGGEQSNPSKLVLPLSGNTAGCGQSILEQLIHDCDPATFGKGSQDVFDPEYRRAGKMDPHNFATNFHPADFGLIENIEQILLPSIKNEIYNMLGFERITAELYKLNIYSGPSGLFRKHVDTPRSENQIGSLVVCLPSQFEGGMFTVQHGGQKVEFDWSKQSDSAIQWAAFYSDCEHEIQTVTKGERITLTYNLYNTQSAREIRSNNSIIAPQSLPLYAFLRGLLSREDFMPEGGVLGVYCSHSYPHNTELANWQLPRGLKGSDLVLYSVFRSLGIDVHVRPVLEHGDRYGSRNPELGIEGIVGNTQNPHWGVSEYLSEELLEYLITGKIPENLDSSAFLLTHGVDGSMDIDSYWQFLLMARRVKDMRGTVQFANKECLATDGGVYAEDETRLGTQFHPHIITTLGYEQGGESDEEVAQDAWPHYHLPGIVWINEPKHEEGAFSRVVYGNGPHLEHSYSCAAILAVIPAMKDRKEVFEQ